MEATLTYLYHHPWLMVGLISLTSVGLALTLMAWLALMTTALGRRQWLWGLGVLLLYIPVAPAFALRYPKLNPWANRLCWYGLLLMVPVLVLQCLLLLKSRGA
ncbi:hypothetical protein PVT67_00235 [Gallaecimonas kandeliae]|uniref:hypothetical protein n=1 Tax=Gallaecimonas kandeliae TaxID=3029055 RepID=UPI0026491F4A|nr:hypothetical protein [Gallaecimonas kandeliae]WKE65719.1 hypothetical protein PVT67_00235 [Gallaecimonas kandeliae]